MIIPSRTLDAPGPVEVDSEEEFFIDRIVDHKKVGLLYKYLVCWKGEHVGADRWITEKYLIETEALEKYWRSDPRNTNWILNILTFPTFPFFFIFLFFWLYFYVLLLLVYIFVFFFCSLPDILTTHGRNFSGRGRV